MNFGAISAIFRWRPACWLKVSGPDANVFLQGQFTNDLRGLSSEPAVYGLWLNVKGKVIADSFVLRDPHEDAYWIGSYFCSAALVRERLESHIIADDVIIEDQTDRWTGITVFGTKPTPSLQTDTAQSEPAAFVFRGRRDTAEHFECVFPSESCAQVTAWFDGAPEIAAEEVAARRVAAGIPAVPVDIGPGDLPNEGGLETSAISYTKGCYLGQEVMARLKSMGQVRRRLLRVRGKLTSRPATPAPVFAGAKQVGELRSAAISAPGDLIGLALVSLLTLQPTTKLAFGADAEPMLALVDAP